MARILDRIIEYKKGFVAACKQSIDPAEMRRRAESAPAPRDVFGALRGSKDIAVIAEIKKASPSKGVIRENFDPVAIGRSYQTGGATAVSCLTDELFFQGSLEIFQAVRASIDLPMLRKEFIIDEYQIDEARAAGADMALLIVSILSDDELSQFRRRIEDDLGMAALVEAHSVDEAKRAAQCGARLIGVNNRDLSSPDFHTDVRHTESILPHLPDGALRVSESGIHGPEDVDYLRGLGIDAILVGEQLMRQPDPGKAIHDLLGASG